MIKGKYFPYGIHVRDEKAATRDKPIEQIPAPAEVAICVSQHIGAPAVPVVSAGDTVKKGQLVAEASGALSANVFASVSGQVVGVEELVNPFGVRQKYVRIKNDFKDEAVTLPDMKDFSPQSIVGRIREAGIVGLGGAGFPTAVKLSPQNRLDTLIVNAAECEPYLNCDFRLMLEKTDGIVKGIRYVAQALGIRQILIGIEANKPEAIERFEGVGGMTVVRLKKQYPMGSEKHLVYCCTGRKIAPGKMPFDVGCLVQNVKTLLAAYEAIDLNLPLTEIVMTVSGKGIRFPKNVRVPIGTSFEDIAAFCGGETDRPVKYVAGGPMMGKALYNLRQYAKKTDSGLLFLTEGETSLEAPSTCINCGRCAKNCPMWLMPMYIEFYTLAGDYEAGKKYGALSCIECGSCAYNCPAKRALVQSIVLCKNKLKEKK